MPEFPASRMKMFVVITESHRVLFEKFFLPSLDRSQFELHERDFSVEGLGDFLADDFKAAIRFKLDSIIRSIVENPGEVILWSDVDIQFYGLRPEHVIRYMEPNLDFAVQRLNRTGNTACGGFYAIRCSARTLAFFEQVRELTINETAGNEQDAINLLLARDHLQWCLLGPEFYARTHGMRIPAHAVLHHATCVVPGNSVQQKVHMLSELEHFARWNTFSKAAYYLRELPAAAARMVRLQTMRRFAS